MDERKDVFIPGTNATGYITSANWVLAVALVALPTESPYRIRLISNPVNYCIFLKPVA
jgi:hypothetical protein